MRIRRTVPVGQENYPSAEMNYEQEILPYMIHPVPGGGMSRH